MIYNYLINITLENEFSFANAQETELFLRNISAELKLTTLKSATHKFQPYGVTSLLLLSESHISLHTWPEYNFGCIDLLTCKEKIDANFLEDLINKHGKGIKCSSISEIERKAANNVYEK